MRVGTGYDVHRLAPGRRLMLGGLCIPFEKGLIGHSDADVLLHAVCDALLGAAGLDDIGVHFPDTNSRYKDIDSTRLLIETLEKVRAAGFHTIINLDATIFAQQPKISPFRLTIKHNLAQALGIEPQRVNIKATTTEGLGMIGNEEGIGAMAVVLIE